MGQEDPPVFLTDTRRKVLMGEYDGADSNERSHRSRIRSRARTALDELLAIAASEEIDNSEVFEAEKLRALITTLKRPGGFQEQDEEYANKVHVAVDKAIHGIDSEHVETPDPREE
jgi:hypothetical protein